MLVGKPVSCAPCTSAFTDSFLTTDRVAALESQISDLQTEATRLIRSLDTQKDLAESQRKEMERKVEDLSRERDARVKEVDGYKEKVKQYADYDEVKRELDIMKVGLVVYPLFLDKADSYNSTSSLQEWRWTKAPATRTL